jgi:ribosomal protein L11 methyltransferase
LAEKQVGGASCAGAAGRVTAGKAAGGGAAGKAATGATAQGSEPSALGAGVWVELSVAADIEAVEAVSEILTRFAPGGTSVEPGFGLTNEGLGAVVDPTKPAIVRAYLPGLDPAGVERSIAEASAALGHLQAFGLRPIGELQTRLVNEEDWAEAWKSHFPVLRIGRRIVIRPTWRRRHKAGPDDVVLSLDPGMAFGTGLHPTTRLCLAALEAIADEGGLERGHSSASGPAAAGGARVIDVGCGSGILAIAAAQLGAGELLGVDVDPIAVEATRANARLNGLARRLPVELGSVPSGHGPFDLVLANLIASLLVQLAPALRDEMVSGGRILASGIFKDREGDVRAAFEGVGLRMGRRWAEDDWVALEAFRP